VVETRVFQMPGDLLHSPGVARQYDVPGAMALAKSNVI